MQLNYIDAPNHLKMRNMQALPSNQTISGRCQLVAPNKLAKLCQKLFQRHINMAHFALLALTNQKYARMVKTKEYQKVCPRHA